MPRDSFLLRNAISYCRPEVKMALVYLFALKANLSPKTLAFIQASEVV